MPRSENLHSSTVVVKSSLEAGVQLCVVFCVMNCVQTLSLFLPCMGRPGRKEDTAE